MNGGMFGMSDKELECYKALYPEDSRKRIHAKAVKFCEKCKEKYGIYPVQAQNRRLGLYKQTFTKYQTIKKHPVRTMINCVFCKESNLRMWQMEKYNDSRCANCLVNPRYCDLENGSSLYVKWYNAKGNLKNYVRYNEYEKDYDLEIVANLKKKAAYHLDNIINACRKEIIRFQLEDHMKANANLMKPEVVRLNYIH